MHLRLLQAAWKILRELQPLQKDVLQCTLDELTIGCHNDKGTKPVDCMGLLPQCDVQMCTRVQFS